MQSDTPHIRPWTPADAGRCLTIFQTAIRGGDFYSRAQRLAWANLPYSFGRWRVRQGQNVTLVATRTARIVGFTEYRPDGHVHMLFVAPEAMRQGVASALLAAGDRALAARGVTRRDTWASLSSAPVFARVGYQHMGRVAKPTDGERLLTTRMVRR